MSLPPAGAPWVGVMSLAQVVLLMDGHDPPEDAPLQNTGYWMNFCHRFEADYGHASLRRILLLGMGPIELSVWYGQLGRRNARVLARAATTEDKKLWALEQKLRDGWARKLTVVEGRKR